MFNLQGVTPPVEGVAPTSKEKGVEPTTPKVEPTISITETDEFRHALDKALGKGLASTQSQLSLSQSEARQFKAQLEARDAKIEAMQKEVDEVLVDDPEKRQAYISRIAGLEREQKIAEREYAVELAEHKQRMDAKANEVMARTGIPVEQLLGSISEEEMELRATRYERDELKKSKEPEKEPKFESGVSSGGDASWRNLSPDEKIARGLSRKK